MAIKAIATAAQKPKLFVFSTLRLIVLSPHLIKVFPVCTLTSAVLLTFGCRHPSMVPAYSDPDAFSQEHKYIHVIPCHRSSSITTRRKVPPDLYRKPSPSPIDLLAKVKPATPEMHFAQTIPATPSEQANIPLFTIPAPYSLTSSSFAGTILALNRCLRST
jgi:hypothetical protein